MHQVNATSLGNRTSGPVTAFNLPVSTVAVFISMAVVILLENATVCFLFIVEKHLRSIANVFVVSLAVSDLSVALLFVPAYLALDVRHEAHLYIMTFLLFTSLFNLCGVTYDRYQAIIKPLTYNLVFTTWRVSIILVAIWLCPILLILLSLTWSGADQKTNMLIGRIYLGFMVFVVFFTCVVIVKIYFRIWKEIKRHMKMTRKVNKMFTPSELSTMSTELSRIERSNAPSCTAASAISRDSTSSSNPGPYDESSRISTCIPRGSAEHETEFSVPYDNCSDSISNEGSHQLRKNLLRLRLRFRVYKERMGDDIRAVRLLAAVILIFIICWCPSIFINFMFVIDRVELVPSVFFDISVYAFIANAIVNPLLFTFYKRDYRKALLYHIFYPCRRQFLRKQTRVKREAPKFSASQ